jgi:hypothetical protein
MWILEHQTNKAHSISQNFDTRDAADRYRISMGATVGRYYKVVYESGNPKADRMLTEGLVKGDLYKILLPRISVDEFVPGDPDTDNIVIAFFLKGVPEATLPFKTFVEQSNGVISADYGDSETIMGAQNVYCEFDRENLDMADIHAIIVQATMLAGIEPEDFTMTFPHTDEKFPYDPKSMKEYFISRDQRKNEIAQKRAIDRAAKEFEDSLQQSHKRNHQQQQNQQKQSQTDAEHTDDHKQAQESLIVHLSGVSLTG